MEQVTHSPVCTALAKQAIESAKKYVQAGFSSPALRDAHADYLQIPYGDLRRALELHCERAKLANNMRGSVLPLTLGQVRQHHLQFVRSLTPDFQELAGLVDELLRLRLAIKSATIW